MQGSDYSEHSPNSRLHLLTGVLNTWFLGRPEVIDLIGLDGPGGPNKLLMRGGQAAHLFNEFPMPLGRPEPKIDDCWSAKNLCITNPGVTRSLPEIDGILVRLEPPSNASKEEWRPLGPTNQNIDVTELADPLGNPSGHINANTELPS